MFGRSLTVGSRVLWKFNYGSSVLWYKKTDGHLAVPVVVVVTATWRLLRGRFANGIPKRFWIILHSDKLPAKVGEFSFSTIKSKDRKKKKRRIHNITNPICIKCNEADWTGIWTRHVNYTFPGDKQTKKCVTVPNTSSNKKNLIVISCLGPVNEIFSV